MQLGSRLIASVCVVATCWAGAGCGSGRVAAPGPAAGTSPPATPTSTAPPGAPVYPDPFGGLREAEGHAAPAAALLAGGLAGTEGLSGAPTSAAADLRASLTLLLTEHVGLVGLVFSAMYAKGTQSEQAKQALGAVRENAKALAAKIKSVARAPRATSSPTSRPSPSPEATSGTTELTSTDFLTAWNAHVDELVNYATAAKDKISADEDDARRHLDTWRQNAGSALKSAARGKLRSTDVRDALDKYVTGMTKAADSLATRDGKGYDQLRSAASAGADLAAVLADGFARSDGLTGDSNAETSAVRAQFTYLLAEHVGLTAAVVYAGYTAGDGALQSTDANAAKAALDVNAKDLAAALGKAASARDQALFLEDWRRYVIELVNYAEAVRVADSAAAEKATGAIDSYHGTAGAFFEKITGRRLTAAGVAAALSDLDAGLTGEIRALAALLLAAH